MGLSVSLGLDRFWLDEAETESTLKAIIETGSIEKVRVVITENDVPRIKEASKAEGTITIRLLSDDETQAILNDIEELTKKHGGRSVSFSWDETENLAFDVQDLALLFSANADPMEMHSFKIGSDTVRMISIHRSKKFNWTKKSKSCNFARAIHELAERHHLIMHSA